eukprot:jgi/Botrbrau1/3806/Bobra.0183s0038.1
MVVAKDSVAMAGLLTQFKSPLGGKRVPGHNAGSSETEGGRRENQSGAAGQTLCDCRLSLHQRAACSEQLQCAGGGGGRGGRPAPLEASDGAHPPNQGAREVSGALHLWGRDVWGRRRLGHECHRPQQEPQATEGGAALEGDAEASLARKNPRFSTPCHRPAAAVHVRVAGGHGGVLVCPAGLDVLTRLRAIKHTMSRGFN